MAHIQTTHLGLWKPQDLTVDKINSQKMFVDNVNTIEEFATSMLKRSAMPVASIAELRAINTSDTTIYTDSMIVMVKSNGLYFFDRSNSSADNGSTIIAPTTGGGRWVSINTFFGNLAFKNSLTKSDVGLSNVPNVATNDQTPTYSQSSTLANLVSGEKLSISMGKIMKGLADLITHLSNKLNPHSVTATQVGLGNVDNTSDINKPVSTAQAGAIAIAKSAGDNAQANLTIHINNKSNPHEVTKSQVGLGNVPNVTTNNQTPTYTQATTLANLVSGETLAVSMGKIMKVVAEFIAHLANKSNPHEVTKSQVGLGSVPNVATNDQTPTYTQATTLANLVSGEKLSVSFGKIMKAIADLIAHLANKSNPHSVTKSQVGLGNVDNTSDINKPISTATQTALNTINSNLCGSVKGLSELRAINTSNTTMFKNGTLIMVQENGIYSFNRSSTADDDNNAIIAPTTGGGRWITTTTTDIALGLRQISNDNELDGLLTTILTNMSDNSVKFIVVKTVSGTTPPFYGGIVHMTIYKVNNLYATITGIVYNMDRIARQFTRVRYDGIWGGWTSLPFLDANGKIPLDQLPSSIMSASIE